MVNRANNSEYLKEMARQHKCRALVGKTARTFDVEGKLRVLPGDDGSTPSPAQAVKGPGCFRREIRRPVEF